MTEKKKKIQSEGLGNTPLDSGFQSVVTLSEEEWDVFINSHSLVTDETVEQAKIFLEKYRELYPEDNK